MRGGQRPQYWAASATGPALPQERAIESGRGAPRTARRATRSTQPGHHPTVLLGSEEDNEGISGTGLAFAQERAERRPRSRVAVRAACPRTGAGRTIVWGWAGGLWWWFSPLVCCMVRSRRYPVLHDERQETPGPATTPRAFSEVRKTGDSAELVMPPHRSGPNHRLGLGWWAVVVVQSAGVLHGAFSAIPRSGRRVTRNARPGHDPTCLLVSKEEDGGLSRTGHAPRTGAGRTIDSDRAGGLWWWFSPLVCCTVRSRRHPVWTTSDEKRLARPRPERAFSSVRRKAGVLAPRPALADARAMKPGRGAPRLDDERREAPNLATT